MSYKNVKNLLYYGQRKIANNTYLTLTDAYDQPGMIRSECIEMRLHGNLVARFYSDYLQLLLLSADWHSATTKNRLNLALTLAQTPYVANVEYPYWRKIYQVNRQWYYGNYQKGDPMFEISMKINYQGDIIP